MLVGQAQQRLSEGLRAWLAATFGGVFVVADRASLIEGVLKLQPELVVVDLALAEGRVSALVAELHRLAPRCRTLVLSDHDDAHIDASILSAGADGVVRKALLAKDLSIAVDTVLAGGRYAAPADPH